MNENYYYIMIDKVEKTIRLVKCQSCLATTQNFVFEKLGYKDNKGFFNWSYLTSRYKWCWNNQSEFIDKTLLYKYAQKYKELEPITE